jgi:hypothetical protein
VVILFSKKHFLKFGNEIQKTQRRKRGNGYEKIIGKEKYYEMWLKFIFCKMCNEINIAGHQHSTRTIRRA